jgi:hypothetical protein
MRVVGRRRTVPTVEAVGIPEEGAMRRSQSLMLAALVACGCGKDSTECADLGAQRCSGSTFQGCQGSCMFGSCDYHWTTVATCPSPLVCRIDGTFPKDPNSGGCVEANRFCGNAEYPAYSRCADYSLEGVPDKLYQCVLGTADPGVWQWSVAECAAGQRCASNVSGAGTAGCRVP